MNRPWRERITILSRNYHSLHASCLAGLNWWKEANDEENVLHSFNNSFVYQPHYPFIYAFIYPFNPPFIYVHVHPSIHLSIHLYIHPSIHPYTHPITCHSSHNALIIPPTRHCPQKTPFSAENKAFFLWWIFKISSWYFFFFLSHLLSLPQERHYYNFLILHLL